MARTRPCPACRKPMAEHCKSHTCNWYVCKGCGIYGPASWSTSAWARLTAGKR